MGVAVHLVRGDPRYAARAAPDDAQALMATAQQLVTSGTPVDAPEVRALVARALAHDLSMTPAIEYRAMQAAAMGDHVREARLFALSAEISKRSLATRLWLIQRSVDRGEVEPALEDFDIALRTSTAAPGLLFPILARATSDPGLVVPIARILDRREEWRTPFLHYAITDGGAAEGIAQVALAMRDGAAITTNGIDRTLVGRLVAADAFALAHAVSERYAPAGTALVRDRHFADAAIPAPFGWTLSPRDEAAAERSRAGGQPVLAYRARPWSAGEVATQLLLLRPGRYRLAVQTAIAPADPKAPPYWTITCGEENGAQILLLDQPYAAGAVASAAFDVDSDCTGQWMALHLRASDTANGQSGAIAAVQISRL